jgi:hypothetical protein
MAVIQLATLMFLVACSASAVTPAGTPSGQPTGQAPSIVAAPASARPGDTITLSGVRWPARARLSLGLNPANPSGQAALELGNTLADEQGRFTFVALVPSAASAGAWTLVVRTADASGQVNALTSTPFTVLASDAPTPAPTLPPTATETELPPPTAPPVPPTATPMPPTVTAQPPPTLTPVPPTPAPEQKPQLQGGIDGNTLVLRGTGWNAGQLIRVRASRDKDAKDVTWLGQVNADAQGHFEFSAKLPKQLRGVGYVIVADDTHRVMARLVKTGD